MKSIPNQKEKAKKERKEKEQFHELNTFSLEDNELKTEPRKGYLSLTWINGIASIRGH